VLNHVTAINGLIVHVLTTHIACYITYKVKTLTITALVRIVLVIQLDLGVLVNNALRYVICFLCVCVYIT